MKRGNAERGRGTGGVQTGRTNCIWIAWEQHRRSESLASELGVPLHIFTSKAARWRKHPTFAARTLRLLLRARPRVLMVQNPSWLLTWQAMALRPLLRYKLIVDAHNGGVYPFEAWHRHFRWVFPIFHRGADLTLVTNEAVAAIVRANGGQTFVLPDPLPAWAPMEETDSSITGSTVTCICSFAADEPYEEMVAAGRLLPDGVELFITGDVEKRAPALVGRAPANVRFTGYLDDAAYERHLRQSAVIVDLTAFDDCLVCGAYEAVALGIPLVLSDTAANRAYFDKGVVYTENTAGAISQAIRNALDCQPALRREVGELRVQLSTSWRRRRDELISMLSVMECDFQEQEPR